LLVETTLQVRAPDRPHGPGLLLCPGADRTHNGPRAGHTSRVPGHHRDGAGQPSRSHQRPTVTLPARKSKLLLSGPPGKTRARPSRGSTGGPRSPRSLLGVCPICCDCRPSPWSARCARCRTPGDLTDEQWGAA
jgi:hypothetical protein